MKKEKNPGAIGREEALTKIHRYCAYQERCHSEVRNKLSEFGMWGEDSDNIMAQLIQEGFLNEERFAKMFAGGKFRVKKWGRLKIRRALEEKYVSEYCISKGLEEINETEYLAALKNIIHTKDASLDEENIYTRKNKISKYAAGKGYEPELVWSILGRN